MKDQQTTARKIANQKVHIRILIQKIMSKAITVTQGGHAHVFVNYYGHVDSIDIDALSADTDYQAEAQKKTIMAARVSLTPYPHDVTEEQKINFYNKATDKLKKALIEIIELQEAK